MNMESNVAADVSATDVPPANPPTRWTRASRRPCTARALSSDALAPWRAAYDGEPFIELTSEPPALRDVVHRNVVRIGAVPLAGTRRPTVLVMSAIDNLVKGAAGQAVQNANLMLGLNEGAGLPA